MVTTIEHKVEGIDNVISTNYSEHFHSSWLENKDMIELLNSNYMSNLNHYMMQTYLTTTLIYPRVKSNIYRVFNTSLEDIKVVIFANEPFPNMLSNGLAYGEYPSPGKYSSKEVVEFQEVLSDSFHDSLNKEVTQDLKYLAKQGVFLFNTALISEGGTKNKHLKIFRNFTRQVIKIINEELTDVVFVFTDNIQSKEFRRYINEDYHSIIQVDGIKKGSEVFEQINEKILDTLGSREFIEWL